jgi:Zn-dependent protease
MNGYFSEKMLELSLLALPFLFAVTMREAFRGWVAHKLGDPSAKLAGRLTANPLAHADPIWTGVVPVVAFVLLNFPILLGQAKPMPVDMRYFKNPRRDMMLFALAGPASGFLVAIGFAIIHHIALNMGMTANDWLVITAYYGVYLSMIFTVIGLLPVPPLDGGRILELLLPHELAEGLRSMEPYSFFIVIGIFILAPAIFMVPGMFLTRLILTLVGIII